MDKWFEDINQLPEVEEFPSSTSRPKTLRKLTQTGLYRIEQFKNHLIWQNKVVSTIVHPYSLIVVGSVVLAGIIYLMG